MSRPENQNEAGLTIVETLIVLATAAVILLIVLLAIPTLQRNSRNNQRTQDAQTILAAVSQWELNHAGTIPDTTNLQNFLTSYYSSKLTFFEPTGISVSTPSADSVPPPPTPADLANLIVSNHYKCSGASGATSQGAGYSDVVALYFIETSNGKALHCEQL